MAATQTHTEMKLEVDILPVSDVDRSKQFYAKLGWRLDADFSDGKGWHAVQMTPPGSPCSIIFGAGVTKNPPGSGLMFLVVDDVEQARKELIANGVEVSEVFHFGGPLRFDGQESRVPGRDPTGDSYKTWASFRDPDGNGWVLQEIKKRLPGRGLSNDVPQLTDLLKEAEEHHGAFEKIAPKHHWSGWYAKYIIAREQGRTPDDAAKEASAYMMSIIQ